MPSRRPSDDDFEFDDDDWEPRSRSARFLHKSLGVAGRLLSLPFVLFATLGSMVRTFLHAWFQSRPWLTFVRGIPFVLAVLTVGFLLLQMGRNSRADLVLRYQESAARAAAEGNTEVAALWLEKIARLNPQDPRHLYRQALMADEAGRRDRARTLMQRIAPADGEGYPLAHFWLARDLIGQSLPLTPELSKTIEHHLNQALRSKPLAAETHALLGQLMVLRGDRPQAISHFELAAGEKPECHLGLAVLYLEQQEPDKAARSAGLAADYFGRLVEAEPETWTHRLRWAQAELLRDHYARAVGILEAAVDKVEDPEPFREALVAAHLRWLADLAQREPNRLDQQLDLLNAAFKYGPENPDVLALIANLATQQRDDADSQPAAELHEALTRILAGGTAPPVVHLIVGTRALEAGEVERAVTHLELALKAIPNMPMVLNNLAWGLAHREPPDLDRSLRLIDAAIPLSDHPHLRGTRAVILVELGRSREAINELEGVLRRHPDPAWVHAQLADLYRQAGVEDLAELHAQLAVHFRKPPDE
jgi:tetratricopeptide (TPR) repeat protein